MQKEVVANLVPLKIEATPELRQKIKIRTAVLGVSMREYVTEAVEQRLDEEDTEEK